MQRFAGNLQKITNYFAKTLNALKSWQNRPPYGWQYAITDHDIGVVIAWIARQHLAYHVLTYYRYPRYRLHSNICTSPQSTILYYLHARPPYDGIQGELIMVRFGMGEVLVSLASDGLPILLASSRNDMNIAYKRITPCPAECCYISFNAQATDSIVKAVGFTYG